MFVSFNFQENKRIVLVWSRIAPRDLSWVGRGPGEAGLLRGKEVGGWRGG